MSSWSLLSRIVSSGALLAALCFPVVGRADDEDPPAVLDGTHLVEMVPATGIVGDGSTHADLYLLALAPDGTPLTGLAFKSVLNTGSVGALIEVGGGLWRLDYTPPKVDTKITAELTLRGKIGKENFTGTWKFEVAPARTHQFSVAANPPRMTLGVDKTASISVNLATGDRGGSGGVQLAIAATVGTVETITDLGNGQFSALYVAPKELNAAVALLTISDKRDPSHTLAALAIPLAAKIELAVTAAPKTQVVVKIGEQSFGPVPVDGKGRAKVPLLVSPGTTSAEKLTVAADGSSVREPLDLKLVEARRIALVPIAAGLPADSRTPVEIFAAVVTPDGRPDTAAPVTFAATSGTMGGTRHVGNGIYAATFTPATSGLPSVATITASLPESVVQKATLPVNLVAVRPDHVEVIADPTHLAPGATTLKATARVTGPDGAGIPGRPVTFTTSGARPGKDPVKDAGKGDYVTTFLPTGNGPVELAAAVGLPVTGDPLTRLLIIPRRTQLNNDGLSSTLVTVAAIDEFGYPVPGVLVELKVTKGDGSLPGEVTTNAAGVAQVYYTAGRASGLVEFEATTLELKAVGAIFQAPDAMKLPRVPVAGSRDEASWVAEWRKSVGELRVERDGAAP